MAAKTVRVAAKPSRFALLAPRQAAAQLLRSLDSATGGASLQPPGTFLNAATILALPRKIGNANTKKSSSEMAGARKTVKLKI